MRRPKRQPEGAARLEALRSQARDCRDCPLWTRGTQTVFGEGDPKAKIMLVGEQPGDQEDLQGHPFVGPAGRILDQALLEAGIDRSLTYVTNAVKHFKWEPRGKRRMHKTPAQRELEACYQWLQGEIDAVRPRLIVAMGATAGKSLLGGGFKITQSRGKIHTMENGCDVIPTFHPSYLLRLKGREGEEEAWRAFVSDLKAAAKYVKD